MPTVIVFSTADGCFSTCLSYNVTKRHRDWRKLFYMENLNNQPWPLSELSTITDKSMVAPVDGSTGRQGAREKYETAN